MRLVPLRHHGIAHVPVDALVEVVERIPQRCGTRVCTRAVRGNRAVSKRRNAAGKSPSRRYGSARRGKDRLQSPCWRPAPAIAVARVPRRQGERSRPLCQCRTGSRSPTAAAPPRSIIAEQRAHRGMGIAVSVLEFGAVRRRHHPSRHGSTVRNTVTILNSRAVAQRIMHDVKAGSAPQHDAIARHVGFKFRHRHDGAQRHIADRAAARRRQSSSARNSERTPSAATSAAPENVRPSAVVTATRRRDPRSRSPSRRERVRSHCYAGRRRARRYADRCGER